MSIDETTSEELFLPEEVSLAFARSYGLPIGSLTMECLQLKKQVSSLQQYANNLESTIIELTREKSNLVSKAIADETRIHKLESELGKLLGLEDQA